MEEALNFDELDIELDNPVEKSNPEVVVEEKKKPKTKGEKKKPKVEMGEEIKEVVDKYADTVEEMKLAENLKLAAAKEKKEREAERRAKIEANLIYVDAQNSDDRAKLMDLMNQGRIVVTDKSKPFILCEQRSPLYNVSKPAIHTVMCEEITSVIIRRYYTDLEVMPVNNRTLFKTDIWAYHNGYASMSMISNEQLEYLLRENFIIKDEVFYSYIDISEGTSYFLGNVSIEPDLPTLERFRMSNMESHNALKGKVVFKDKPVDIQLVEEPVREIISEVDMFEDISLEEVNSDGCE